jgi:hypothetical protein
MAMHKRTGLLAGLALSTLLVSAPAFGEDNVARYRYLTIIDDQTVMVDDPGIVRDGDIRTYWTLWIPISQGRAIEMRPVAYHLIQFRADCARHTIQPVAMVVYDDAGGVLEATRPNREPFEARAGGAHMQVVTYVCSGRLPDNEPGRRPGTLAQMLDAARRTRDGEVTQTPAR